MSAPDWNPPTTGMPWGDGNTPEIRVGSLYGARAFRMTEDGWLTGVTFKQPWKPGPNRSQCWKPTGRGGVDGALYLRHVFAPTTITHTHRDQLTYWRGDYYYTPNHDVDKLQRDIAEDFHGDWSATERDGADWFREHAGTSIDVVADSQWGVVAPGSDLVTLFTEKPPVDHGNSDNEHHTPAGCACGFHGYLKGSVDFAHDAATPAGIVRAWGTMSLGSRGFRAQWAEIVALYMPPARTPQQVAGGLTLKYVGDVPPHVAAQRVAVMDRYGVPVFSSLEAMLAEFPTTPPREQKEKNDE